LWFSDFLALNEKSQIAIFAVFRDDVEGSRRRNQIDEFNNVFMVKSLEDFNLANNRFP